MSKNVILTASFILWTHFAFAENILLSADVPLSSVPQLNPREIKNDLDILLATLDKAYGGKGILPGNQYVDLVSGLERLEVSPAVISSQDLCNQIAELTEKINDDHLTVHIGDKTCQRKWPVPNVGSNSGYGNSNPTWSLSVKKIENHSIPVLSIQKMSPSASPDWNGFLEAVQGLVKGRSPFVIDLRRNPGGDSTKGLQMAAILYGVNKVEDVPMPVKQIFRQRSPEAWAVLANASWLEMKSLKEERKPVPAYISDNYQSLVQYREKALQGLIPALEVQRLGQEKIDLTRAISFPVYVLIDRNCGSSCELTLEALEKLPSIQTVGENTTGVVQYGNVGALYLPSSHIVIRMPTQGSKYDDQRHIEKIGYAPKWKVPLGTDALEYALSHFFAE